MPYLILVGILAAFIGLYMGAMYLNSKVAIPESCKEAYLEAQTCESCSTKSGRASCNFNDALEFMKEVKL
ncbi:MAG TPA: hypothetical protein P5091_00735 [Acholeplasmataceae bacterium]|jgi:hypothetical protein|nr:hypothetical protein [Acholeplasmataceae bacterium]